MVRYADDFVILCRTREDADRALEMVQTWVAENDLTLHPTKTNIVDAAHRRLRFSGVSLQARQLRLPREKSLKKFKDDVRAKTKRTNGHDMPAHVSSVSPQLARVVYLLPALSLVASSANSMAGYAGRLRSILRKRQRRRGRGRGKDHQRWPNALLRRTRVVSALTQPMLVSFNPLEVKPSTGEPDAGNPPVRFGGRGGRTQSAFPTPIGRDWCATTSPPRETETALKRGRSPTRIWCVKHPKD